MFYCTIYTKAKARDSWSVELCLSYASKVDAENYAATLAKQASNYGAQVEAHDSAYVITGTAYFGFAGFGRSRSNTFSYYMISIEDDASKFSLGVPGEYRREVEDGFKFEERAALYLNRVAEKRAKEDEKINYNLSRFEAEIMEESDLTKILTSLLKYAGQKTNKQKLIALTVKKIQGESAAEEESNWYDELSDINN